ncbi:hypothetical protein V5O48_013056 [Marasmius crinis-equi]|uniref:Uncharacterized protein n=1 Tax=Marasmius crinis-equi TaxID=585013 RepID=A0ABR3F1J6_9AGAR
MCSGPVYFNLIPDDEHIPALATNDPDASPFQLGRDNDNRPDLTCYLFVAPPSQLPNLNPDSSLRDGNSYYWSVDPNGKSSLSEEERVSFGLPHFTHGSYSYYSSYPVEVYDFIQRWQEAKGFDPKTTEFARSLGYPILEILSWDEEHFENIAGCDEVDPPANQHKLFEEMDVDRVRETSPHVDFMEVDE